MTKFVQLFQCLNVLNYSAKKSVNKINKLIFEKAICLSTMLFYSYRLLIFMSVYPCQVCPNEGERRKEQGPEPDVDTTARQSDYSQNTFGLFCLSAICRPIFFSNMETIISAVKIIKEFFHFTCLLSLLLKQRNL